MILENVISLFDGMSCGQQAFERAGHTVKNYYASEIDKHAIKVTMANYPNTIQLGSVVDLDVSNLPRMDALIGGSPCQSFSFAGKRKGMVTKDEIKILTLDHYLQLKKDGFEFEGQSYLFWEYIRVLTELRKKNPDIIFLLENVMMGKNWARILSRAIGVNPICINSSLLSAQNRERLYWTNIGAQPDGFFGHSKCFIKQPKDKKLFVSDIIEKEVNPKYFLSKKCIDGLNRAMKRNHKPSIIDFSDKANSLDTRVGAKTHRGQYIIHNMMPRSSKTGKGGTGQMTRTDGKTYCLDTGKTNAIEYEDGIRQFTPTECERLQTVADGYTNHVSDSQRYRMLGNGWTIDVIAYIFSYLK